MVNTKKLAIFALSNKGGVGKTTLAKAFTDYMRRERLNAAIYDTDGDVKGLLKLYGKTDDGGVSYDCDPIKNVGYFNMQVDADRENVVNSIESRADIVFFDTPAGSIRKIFTSLNNAQHFVDTLNIEGYELVLLLLVDPYDDTIDGIQSAIDLFGEKAKYIVWKNMNNAKKDDFVYFEPTTILADAEPMFLDPKGATDLADAVRTAVINKRAGGTGLISGRKAFQKPMAEGIELLNAVQDVYLDQSVTIA